MSQEPEQSKHGNNVGDIPLSPTTPIQLEHERTVETGHIDQRSETNLSNEHNKCLELLPDDIKNNPDSIIHANNFPASNGRPHEFTPSMLLQAMTVYATQINPDKTPVTLEQALTQAGIREQSAYLLLQKYPDFRQVYDVARATKAKLYNQAANVQYEGDIADNPRAYDVAKDGSMRLSSAYVTFKRDKANHMHRQAVIHDKHTFGEIKQIESKTVSLHLHGKLDAKSRIQDIDALLLD